MFCGCYAAAIGGLGARYFTASPARSASHNQARCSAPSRRRQAQGDQCRRVRRRAGAERKERGSVGRSQSVGRRVAEPICWPEWIAAAAVCWRPATAAEARPSVSEDIARCSGTGLDSNSLPERRGTEGSSSAQRNGGQQSGGAPTVPRDWSGAPVWRSARRCWARVPACACLVRVVEATERPSYSAPSDHTAERAGDAPPTRTSPTFTRHNWSPQGLRREIQHRTTQRPCSYLAGKSGERGVVVPTAACSQGWHGRQVETRQRKGAGGGCGGRETW